MKTVKQVLQEALDYYKESDLHLTRFAQYRDKRGKPAYRFKVGNACCPVGAVAYFSGLRIELSKPRTYKLLNDCVNALDTQVRRRRPGCLGIIEYNDFYASYQDILEVFEGAINESE